MEEGLPVIYQNVNGHQVDIGGRYVIRGESEFGFELDRMTDPSAPVVVDPILIHSVYLGGSSEDWGFAGPG